MTTEASSRPTKGRVSNDDKKDSTISKDNTNSTSSNNHSSSSIINSNKGQKLRKMEVAFLILIAIFLSLSLFVNFIHEFDSNILLRHAHITTHPQFHGVTFHKQNSNVGGGFLNKRKGMFFAVHEEDVVHEGKKNVKLNIASSSSNKTEKKGSNLLMDEKKEVEVSSNSKQLGTSTSSSGKSEQHQLGGLSCSAYGGPSDDIAKEMVYWRDIPSDSLFESPFKHKKKDGPVQYMTFEPDGGGWNNIRMAMETVVVLAHAMGRTLVLPPAQGMYLLRKDRGKQNTDFSFADFFHLESLNNEHSGIDIISTEEFLLREAMTGNMKNKTSGEVSFPPNNRTNWDGKDVKPLKEWLREVTLTPMWGPGQCLAAFPASGDPKDAQDLHDMLETLQKGGRVDIGKYVDHPTPVDAKTIDRMREALANRRKLCIYDHEMQAAPVIHFMCYHKMRVRLLTHFYSFIFFEDWKQQLWTNRFVRDHLRYLDELQCAAARVVDKLHSIAKQEGEPNGQFDTFHVRRGDFQFKDTRVEADVLYLESKEYIPENATLYIATDERKKAFFNDLKDHYNVYFLDDFKDLFKGLNTNYYGMLDQLIASKGRTFVGTYYSTFTGYINRMRGYSSTKMHLEGSKEGAINSYYFVPRGRKESMKHYMAVKGPFFAREFPTSWYDIDKNVPPFTS